MWKPFGGAPSIKKPDSKSKEKGLENQGEKKEFFKDTDELLSAIQSLPDFNKGAEDTERYTNSALEKLKNDKEAIKIFEETSKKFISLQKEVLEEIHRETWKIESERDNPYGNKKHRMKFRAMLWGMTSLFGAFAIADLIQRGIHTDVPAQTFYALPVLFGGVSAFSEYSMQKIVGKAEKEIKPIVTPINFKNKLRSFLEYVSLTGKKEDDGYSYDKELSQKMADLKLGKNTLQGFLDIHNNLVQSESADLLHCLIIAGRYASRLDSEEEIKSLLNKLVEMSVEERSDYEAYLDGFLTNLSENKGIEGATDFEYKMLCKEVYPPGNYDTYKDLDQYKDRTEDLNKFEFNREGMDIYIDGMSGYKMKEGEKPNPEILQEYAKRLQKIESITNPENLTKFLDSKVGSGAQTTEGKLLAYLEQESYSKDAFDAIIAYQLGINYQNMIQRSQDQVNQFEDAETKDYIQLAELADIYGDDLKETVKTIAKKLSEGEDAKLFEKEKTLPEDKLILGERLGKDLSLLPEPARKDATIQKKVETVFKNSFQKDPDIAKGAKEFAALFSAKDFEGDFAQLWRARMKEFFSSKIKGGIDVSVLHSLQTKAFQEIQSEAQKYQELVEVEKSKDGAGEIKTKKLRHLKTYFSKNKENAHARSVAHICIATDPKMLENPDYLELVIFDPERKKNMGTTMLLTMEEPNGKKYLLYNPNPSVGLVSEVSAKRLYKMLTDQVTEFAKDNGFDGILVNPNHGQSTNRGGLFLQALQQSTQKNEEGVEKKINLEKDHLLGGAYKYKDNLSIVWEK